MPAAKRSRSATSKAPKEEALPAKAKRQENKLTATKQKQAKKPATKAKPKLTKATPTAPAQPTAEFVQVESRAELRQWLSKNHARPKGLWLVTYKKANPKKYLPWNDIVQELLCFGWIDAIRRKLDHDRTQLYISPRRPGSGWSGLNKSHLIVLEKENLIQPPGRAVIDRSKADGSWAMLDSVEALIIPPELEEAFKKVKGSKAKFDKLNNAVKRWALHGIASAKRDATKVSRAESFAEKAARGKL